MGEAEQTTAATKVRLAFLRLYREWVCRHALLGLEAALLLALVCGGLGADFGVPSLFWPRHAGPQFQVGFGAALLLGQLCFVGYLLDAYQPWLKVPDLRPRTVAGWLALPCHALLVWVVPPDPTCYLGAGGHTPHGFWNPLWNVPRQFEHLEWARLRWYLAVTWLPLLAVLALPAVVHPAGRTYFLLGIAGLFVAARLTLLGSYWLQRMMWVRGRGAEHWQHLLGVEYGVLLAVLFLVLALTPLGAYASPALALCVLLALVAVGYGLLVLYFPGAKALAAALLVFLLVAVNSWTGYKNYFPGLSTYYDNPVSLEKYTEPVLQPGARDANPVVLLHNDEVLEEWSSRHHGKKLVVLAVAGGDTRAAVWAAKVLATLEARPELPDFPSRLRLITGASGGLFGAAYYTATLRPKGGHFTRREEKLSLDALVKDLEQDSLTPVARDLVLHDWPMLFLPFSYPADRGRALERAWEEQTGGVLSLPFIDLAAGERKAWRPSLVVAPMLLEDGRQLLISNLDLHAVIETRGKLLKPKAVPREATDAGTKDVGRYSLSAVEFYRLFPAARAFRLSTALRMSASFPYLSPAVPLPTLERRRVVDAGAYDEYGVDLATAWIRHHRDWLKRYTSGVILIQVRDALSEQDRREYVVKEGRDREGARAWQWRRGLEGLVGPLARLLSARKAVASFRNDEQVEALHDYFNRKERLDFFTTVVFQCPTRFGHNWYLTDQDAVEVEAGFDPNTDKGRENLEALARLQECYAR